MLSVPLVPQHSCRLDMISMTDCSYFGDTSFGYPAAVGDRLVQPWITSDFAATIGSARGRPRLCDRIQRSVCSAAPAESYQSPPHRRPALPPDRLLRRAGYRDPRRAGKPCLAATLATVHCKLLPCTLLYAKVCVRSLPKGRLVIAQEQARELRDVRPTAR
jgi:hypothetical protein